MKVKLLALIISLLATQQCLCAKEIIVKPEGAYASVDTAATNDIVKRLLSRDTSDRNAAVSRVKEHADQYAPPALYALSEALFEAGNKDEASFWFYAGQIRSRCDGNLCTDISAREGTAVLNERFGYPINQYTFKNIAMLKQLVPKVIEWDRAAAHNYDRRWMALHGMGAFLEDGQKTAITIPESKWQASDEATRSEYLKGFNEAMKSMPQ